MYLEHFKLNKPPFSLTPNTEFYCDLPTHQDAMAILKHALQDGEGFIKITGEAGTGKTLLCRMLLNHLDETFVSAYLPNPDHSPDSLRLALAIELGLDPEKDFPKHLLIESINQRLLALHKNGKKTVLIIDEAQALTFECLEAVRLLTNLETEERKLLQVVLFGQPELDEKLNQHGLRQFKQRITFSYVLKPLEKQQFEAYLQHRMAKAGYTYGKVFSARAKKKLYRASRGLPRLMNVLCHKALLVSYGRGVMKVDPKSVNRAIRDTESVQVSQNRKFRSFSFLVLGAIALTIATTVYWMLGSL